MRNRQESKQGNPPETQKRNLRIRDGSLTPLLCQPASTIDIQDFLKNKPAASESDPVPAPKQNQFKLIFSFAQFSDRIIDLNHNRPLLDSLQHLASPFQVHKTLDKLKQFLVGTYEFQIENWSSRIPRHKRIHRRPKSDLSTKTIYLNDLVNVKSKGEFRQADKAEKKSHSEGSTDILQKTIGREIQVI